MMRDRTQYDFTLVDVSGAGFYVIVGITDEGRMFARKENGWEHKENLDRFEASAKEKGLRFNIEEKKPCLIDNYGGTVDEGFERESFFATELVCFSDESDDIRDVNEFASKRLCGKWYLVLFKSYPTSRIWDTCEVASMDCGAEFVTGKRAESFLKSQISEPMWMWHEHFKDFIDPIASGGWNSKYYQLSDLRCFAKLFNAGKFRKKKLRS
jgi:hypothetical protein